jgi:hypothetical protein
MDEKLAALPESVSRPRARRVAVALAAFIAFAAASAASEHGLEVFVVVEPAASYSDFEGFDFDPGLGLGAGWEIGRGWWAELRALLTDADRRGAEAEVTSWQLGARRFFATGSAWEPFVAFGGHYQEREVEREVVCVDVRAPCPPRREEQEDLGGFLGGGVDWRFAGRLALRLEGRVALYDSESSGDVESATDVTAGLTYRF